MGNSKRNQPESPISNGSESLLIDDIDRANSPTGGPLKEQHVEELMVSIRDVGLLEPIVVDQSGVLIAGHHRLEAIFRLKEENEESFERTFPGRQVPVHRLPYSAKQDPVKAMIDGVSENTKRRRLDAKTIQKIHSALVEKLGGAKGRPPKGKQAIFDIMSRAFGVSPNALHKQMRKARAAQEQEPASKEVVPEDIVPLRTKVTQRHRSSRKFYQAVIAVANCGLSNTDYKTLAEWCLLPPKERQAFSDELTSDDPNFGLPREEGRAASIARASRKLLAPPDLEEMSD